MSEFQAFFFAFQLLPVALVTGCVGGRTPLADASARRRPGGGDAAMADGTAGGDAGAGDAAIPADSSDSLVPACGSTTVIDTRPVRADILILLDRSESMLWRLSYDDVCGEGEDQCVSRADAVLPAVESLVVENPDINWGLQLFPYPDDPLCLVSSTPQVGVGPESGPAIKAHLAAFSTSASTPTASALEVATAYLRTVEDDRNKAILLATDGYPTCGKKEGESVEQMMVHAVEAARAAKQAGFPVYVVGIGQNVSNLDRLAEAGGTGKYYPATSTAELDNALDSIAKDFSPTCTFRTEAKPPERELAAVYVDGKLVPRDETDGWRFDPADATDATIVLTGSHCASMLAGASSEVQIVFGCADR